MKKATEIAHRCLPSSGSEHPLSSHGRAIAIQHASKIIDDALRAERAECQKIAAMYGGSDAEEIAELIGERNRK